MSRSQNDPATSTGTSAGTPKGPTLEGRLPLAENQRIFREEIAPVFLDGCAPQRAPVAVIVAGQTGAGKTAVTRMVKDALDRGGPSAWINMDFYNPHHPEYARWQAERPQEADALVRPDGDRWWEQAQDLALSRGYNILLESAMVTPAEYEDICRRIRSARLPEGVAPYRIETAFVAVPGPVSRLGVMTRYLDELQRHGHGRLVDPDIHDAALRGVVRGAAALEREGLGDFASVLRRGGETVHMQRIAPGGVSSDVAGTRGAGASLVAAVEREHARVQTTAEAAQFVARHAAAVVTAPDYALPELDRIARSAAPILPAPEAPWRAVADRAAALRTAEPPHRPEPTLLARGDHEVIDLLAHNLAERHTAVSRGDTNPATAARHEHTTDRLLGELSRRSALSPQARGAEETHRRALRADPMPQATPPPARQGAGPGPGTGTGTGVGAVAGAAAGSGATVRAGAVPATVTGTGTGTGSNPTAAAAAARSRSAVAPQPPTSGTRTPAAPPRALPAARPAEPPPGRAR
ncbi:zeta toxin family protein [Streptomyces neyagawaensis]|uniref:UDP-N-acetylglucosamine kinase n=1 Tax=Streptomyces neyagawaensis TaxID=42238 RepID=A0ABV3AXB7_9ACTN